MKVTENKIKLEFKKWATAHGQINSFFWGEPFRSWKENVLDFTVMIGYFTNGNFENNQTGIQINLIFADKKYKDESNVDEIWSDTLQMARDAFQMLNKSTKWRQWGKVVGSPTYTKFNNDTGDVLAGHAVQINFALRDQSGICDIPTFGYDYENQTQPSVDCLPVTLFNSNLTWEQIVVSGEAFEVPDTPVTVKNQGGETLGTANLPSVTGGEIVVTIPPCEDATYKILKRNGEEIERGNIPSGVNKDITVDNSVITLNSNPFIEVQATDSLNVKLLDQNEAEIVPLSVVENVITVNIPTVPPLQGRMPLKTGQSDDGSNERGRNVDFFTLSYLNTFGHNCRFVGKTGGYHDRVTDTYKDVNGVETTKILAFPNSVMYDFDTWNQTAGTVLAFYFGNLSLRNFSAQATFESGLTIEGWTDWKVFNLSELWSLNVDGLSSSTLGWKPLEIGANSIGSCTDNSTQYFGRLANGSYGFITKASTAINLAVRVCAVTGTVIT